LVACRLIAGCGAATPTATPNPADDGSTSATPPPGTHNPDQPSGDGGVIVPPLAPIAPVAKVGEHQSVYEGSRVCLDGSPSTDLNNDPLTFAWQQTSGEAIELTPDSGNPARVCFTAPYVPQKSRLVFELVVSDGQFDSRAELAVDVQPLPRGAFLALSFEGNGSTALDGVLGDYFEDFNAYPVNDSPVDWVDTAANSSLSINDSLFWVTRVTGQTVLTTASTASDIHSHYHIAASATWSNYAFTGRMMFDDNAGNPGVTFFSAYPESTHCYSLRRVPAVSGGQTFQIVARGASITSGDFDTRVVPLPGTWYRYRIAAEDVGTRTLLRARVWQDGTAEPNHWQADCADESAGRLKSGTIGAWSAGAGNKYWDDLGVSMLAGANVDPLYWFDTRKGNSLIQDDLLFDQYPLDGKSYFGTTSALPYIHSHYVGPGSASWKNYQFGGRMYFDNYGAGAGVTFLSSFPTRAAYYKLSREQGSQAMRITALGTNISGGASSTGVTPNPSSWYEYRVEVKDTGARTEIRAKVWALGGAEPANWQADCFDSSTTRLAGGTIGVWSSAYGTKYWRDLFIAPLGGGADPCAVDTDEDGTDDCLDGCPQDPDKDHAGACGCGVSDEDSDGDGASDCSDDCPTDPFKTALGSCGCGVADSDTDADGIADCLSLPVPGDYEQHFEGYACGAHPNDWFDSADGSLVQNDAYYKILCGINNKKFIGTDSTGNVVTHYIGTGSSTWSAFRFTGRMFFTDAASGIGVTFFSGYPTSDHYYRLRRYQQDTDFHLAPRLNGANPSPLGTTRVGAATQTYTWYHFTIEVADQADGSHIRARVWLEGANEPQNWQIDALDVGPHRLTQGTIGIWGSGPGVKYWDDLRVVTLSDDGGDNGGGGTDGGGGDDGGGDDDPCIPDADGDGTPDCNDQCPADPGKIAPGACGCGKPDIDANHNGVIDCVEPPPPPPSSTMTTASRTTGVAPLAVFFDAVGTTSGVYRPADGDYPAVRYAWDFGDSQSGNWTSDGKSKNKALGHLAAHVYDQPGRYTVTLQITAPNGQQYSYSQTIDVQAFSGTTYYVAASGNDLNNGLSESAPLRTFEKAMSFAKTNTRIRFKRGDSWNTSYGASINAAGPGLVDSYGSGALPKITANNNLIAVFKVQGKDWRIADLNIIGPADPAAQGSAVDAGVDNTQWLLLERLKVQGFYCGFTNGWWIPPEKHDHNFFVDCELFGSSNKAMFIGSDRLVVMGCYMHDTQSHILRIWHAVKGLVVHNKLQDPLNAIGSVIKLHNAVEIPNLVDGRWIIISDNIIRGHTWDVTVGTQNATSYEVVRDVLVERNYVTAIAPTQIAFRFSAQNVTARNNIGDMTGTTYTGKLFSVTRWGVEPSPTGARLFNNAVYRNDTGTAMLTEAVLSDTLTYNNLAWSASSGKVTIGVTNGNSLNNLTSNPLWASPAGGNFRLQAGSPAIDAGRPAVVFDDYTGTGRPLDGDARNGAAMDVGPFEFAP
jgi:hypothetical protein